MRSWSASGLLNHTLMSANPPRARRRRQRGEPSPASGTSRDQLGQPSGGCPLRTRPLGNPGLCPPRPQSWWDRGAAPTQGQPFSWAQAPWTAESVCSQFGKFTVRSSVVTGECLHPGPPPAAGGAASCCVAPAVWHPLRGVRGVASAAWNAVRTGRVCVEVQCWPGFCPFAVTSSPVQCTCTCIFSHVCLTRVSSHTQMLPGLHSWEGLLVRAEGQERCGETTYGVALRMVPVHPPATTVCHLPSACPRHWTQE